MSVTRLKGGRVIDPTNRVDEVRDLWMSNGRIVAAPANPQADKEIDLAGMVEL